MDLPVIKLNSGTEIPQLGLGTWQIRDKTECIRSVRTALESGYRHIDTAQIYGNEQYVGEALAESPVERKDVYITTKIWNENMEWDGIIPSFEESLSKLRTEYTDLLLLHFPVTELRRPAWRRMEEIFKSGKAKAIGVSNYTITHLEELLSENEIKPAVNQVELHVFLQQPELANYCRKNGIAIEAYSPLAHGYDMKNKTLEEIGKKYGKSTAQVMIRWCLDKGYITIPKSTNPKHIKENIEMPDISLDSEDMKKIGKLDRNLRTCWDPTHIT